MKLKDYLQTNKKTFVIVHTKDRKNLISGKPQDIYSSLSLFLLNAEVLKVVQEIEDFPYIVVIDCEVNINVSKR